MRASRWKVPPGTDWNAIRLGDILLVAQARLPPNAEAILEPLIGPDLPNLD
jgi:hypothetical protein